MEDKIKDPAVQRILLAVIVVIMASYVGGKVEILTHSINNLTQTLDLGVEHETSNQEV